MVAAKLAEGIRRLKVDTAFWLERLIDECQAGGNGAAAENVDSHPVAAIECVEYVDRHREVTHCLRTATFSS